MIKLENWSATYDNSRGRNEFTAPELIKRYLHGNVYGHDRFEDGEFITTSSVQEFNLDEKFAVTRNTRYELGEMSEEYKKFVESLK